MSWDDPTVVNYDVEFTVEKAWASKKAGDFPAWDPYDGIEVDSKGNLLNPHSYLTIEITAENLSQTSVEATLNNIAVIILDGKKVIRECEAVLLDKNKDSVNNSDYFHYTFASGKKVTFQIGYCLDDKYVKDGMNYAEQFALMQGRNAATTPDRTIIAQKNVAYVLLKPFMNRGANSMKRLLKIEVTRAFSSAGFSLSLVIGCLIAVVHCAVDVNHRFLVLVAPFIMFLIALFNLAGLQSWQPTNFMHPDYQQYTLPAFAAESSVLLLLTVGDYIERGLKSNVF